MNDLIERWICGLALPYGEDARRAVDGRWQLQWFAPGCCTETLRDQRIELRIQHQYDEAFLVDQRHGRLHLWETTRGLWFLARLPATKRGAEVFEMVKSGDDFKMCGGELQVQQQSDAIGRVRVFAARYGELSIVPAAEACYQSTWVAPFDDNARLLMTIQEHELDAIDFTHDKTRQPLSGRAPWLKDGADVRYRTMPSQPHD